MSGEITLTVIGNLTADPELRFTASGSAVVNFTIASAPRIRDKNTNEWTDGDVVYLRAQLWQGQYAENVATSLSRGDRVIASGQLTQRTYETKEGEKRSITEFKVSDIGPVLRYHTAKIEKATRKGGEPTEVDTVETQPDSDVPW